MTAQVKRACLALVIVALVLAAVVAAGFVADGTAFPPGFGGGQTDAAETNLAEGAVEGSLEAPDADKTSSAAGEDAWDDVAQQLFSRAGGAQVAWGEVSEAFADEAFDPQALGASDVASTREGFGAVFDGDGEAVRARIEAALEANGWQHAHEGDGPASGLFRRDRGAYRWAFVQCSPASGSLCATVLLWEGEGL